MQTLTQPQEQNQTLHNILSQFLGVIPSGGSWRAFCPGHNDRRNQSLSIKEGYKGILLKCWAGCSLSEILQAIGLQESDLFYDAPRSRTYQKNGTAFEKVNLNFRWNWRKQTGEMLSLTTARAIVAEDFLSQAQALDLHTLTDPQRIRLQNHIALASSWIRLHESAEALCHAIAQGQRKQEGAHHE